MKQPVRPAKHSPRGSGFVAHLLRALPVTVALSLTTTLAYHFGLFASFETAAVDTYLASMTPRQVRDVVIVAITDEDYRDPRLFGGTSPLRAQTLKSLLDAIIAGGPAVVGVDIATGETPDAEALRALSGVPVVWVRDATPQHESGKARDEVWRLDPVLGQNDVPPGIRTGLSLFPRDADGLVRRYYHHLPIKTTNGEAPPSFAWAILQAYCAPSGDRCRGVEIGEEGRDGESEALWLNLAGDRYTFRKIPAGAVIQNAAPPDEFRGAIVLVGGSYRAARDTHPTPVGPLQGVELTAFAVESELRGGGIRPANEVLMIVTELLAAIGFIWVNWRWKPGSKLNAALMTAGIVVFAVAASYLVFRTFGYWASFLGFAVGVWIEQLNHRAKEARLAHAELEKYRTRYGPL